MLQQLDFGTRQWRQACEGVCGQVGDSSGEQSLGLACSAPASWRVCQFVLQLYTSPGSSTIKIGKRAKCSGPLAHQMGACFRRDGMEVLTESMNLRTHTASRVLSSMSCNVHDQMRERRAIHSPSERTETLGACWHGCRFERALQYRGPRSYTGTRAPGVVFHLPLTGADASVLRHSNIPF